MTNCLIMKCGWFLVIMGLSPMVFAGFLDLPEITETPELQTESLLQDLDVPDVRNRDPDPQAGPRLNVREFRVQGLVDYPELGISRQEVIDRVEAIRFDMMAEGERLESGYTLDELGGISDLLSEIDEETKGRHVGPLELQRLVFLIREQRRRRGITLGMIETVADEITAYYRERGFILAKAYIPKQQVRDGVVNLTLLLGALGEIEVVNNRRYKTTKLQSAFNDIIGEPVTDKAIEERLYLLNDLPGVSVQGFFEAGSQVGDTRLNINVAEEDRFNTNVRLDNHGTKQTGENRLYIDTAFNNPTGLGDQLFLAGLLSFNPGNTSYGAIRYTAHPFSPRFNVSFGVSENDFILDPDKESEGAVDLELSGSSKVVDAALSWQLRRGRIRNSQLGLAIQNIESNIESDVVQGIGEILNDEVKNLILNYQFDFLNERKRRLHQGNIALTSGEFIEGVANGQDENYTYLNIDYSLLSFLKSPFSDSDTRLISRFSAQYAGKGLSSINQFSLAGPTKVRGFASNELFVDDGVYLGVDWLFDAPGFLTFGDEESATINTIKPFLFADYSWGVVQPLTDIDDKIEAQYAAVGTGLQLSFFDDLRGNLHVALPALEKVTDSEDDKDNDSMRVYFDLVYGF